MYRDASLLITDKQYEMFEGDVASFSESYLNAL